MVIDNKACDYLGDAVTNKGMTRIVNRTTKHLRPIKDKFDCIAFRGLSGALIAPIVAQRLRKDIIAVRKNESRHSKNQVEGVAGKTYIILDDFVDCANTITAIYQEIKCWAPKCKLVGIVLYRSIAIDYMASEFLREHKNVWILHSGTKIPIYPQFGK